MSVLTLEAKLERQDPSTPWGFRMQGGKDFNAPLTIQRVNTGSLADKCGLLQGDIILKIGNVGVETLKHKDAQDTILSYGNKLDLLLHRIRDKKKVNFKTWGAQPTQPSYEKFSAPTISSQQPSQAPSTAPVFGVSYNAKPKPFGTTADNLQQQTQNLSISNKPEYHPLAQKYTEVDDRPDPAQHQSKSFKYLQEAINSGQDQDSSPPWKRDSTPSVPKAANVPKPGVWSPGGGSSAPAAKPYQPVVQPPPPPPPAPVSAPAPFRGPPPKPTGIGAVRGKKGDAMWKKPDSAAGGKIPICASCGSPIRGPFVVALGKTWCPDHFTCANPRCGVKLVDIGFVEESGFLYCEKDYAENFAPHCTKCSKAIIGECVNALSQAWHPQCFTCAHCHKPIGGGQFHLEEGKAYCEHDWKQMFQTMCYGCNYPIEPGDRWVEAMGHNYHSECFNCSTCQINLEGQPFVPKAGKPYCKKHAR